MSEKNESHALDQNRALNANHKIVNILRQSKSSTEKIIDDLPDIFGIIDETGRLVKSNDSFGILFDKKPEQLLDVMLSQIFSKKDWSIFENAIHELLNKESVEVELASKGRIFIWKLKKVSSPNKSYPLLIFLLGTDITVLRDREEKLKALTENLQDLVEEKTKNIASLLDSIDQGIFSINKDMTLNAAHSKTAETIFETSMFEKKEFSDFLDLNADIKKEFNSWLEVICLKKAHNKWAKYMMLCPLKQIYFKNKIIKIDFKPIVKNDEIESLLVLASDVTIILKNEEKLKDAEKKQKVQTERILALTRNQQFAIQMFFDEASLYVSKFDSLSSPRDLFSESRLLLILLHTFKGNAGSLGFHYMANLLHGLEDLLELMIRSAHLDDYQWSLWQEKILELKKEFESIKDFRASLLNYGNNSFTINQKAYEKLMKLFKMHLAHPAVRELYEVAKTLDTYKFSEVCQKYQNIIKLYREESHKNIDDLRVLTPDALIRKDILSAFDESIVHLIRNAIDHGIEASEERMLLEKDAAFVSVSFSLEGSYFCLKISDNGRGIDPEKVCLSAIKKSLITEDDALLMTTKEKQELVFLPGFSTKETVSAISGRGAGLDAVKLFMEEKNGYVMLHSIVGEGSTFSLYIPSDYEADRSLF